MFLQLGLVYIMFSDFMYTPILIMTALCRYNRRTVQLCLFLWYYFCGDTIEIPVSIRVILNFIMLKLMWPYIILGRVYSGQLTRNWEQSRLYLKTSNSGNATKMMFEDLVCETRHTIRKRWLVMNKCMKRIMWHVLWFGGV